MADQAGVPGRWTPYRTLLGGRMRSQLAYRTSFAFDLANSVLYTVLEYAEVWLILHVARAVGGLDPAATLLVFTLARLGFAVADLIGGGLDGMPAYIRGGTLEVLLLRPLPLLAQLMAGEVVLRRLGRIGIYLVLLALALARADIDWTPAKVALVPLTVLSAATIFTCLFVLAGAVQILLMDGGEVANAFTYGGAYVASYSTAVLPAPARALFTAVVPAAFCGYLPALTLLDLPGPAFAPTWLGWCTPVVAVAFVGLTGLGWRAGVRHYQGGGG